MNREQEQPDFDPLDALVHEALEVQPSTPTISRLEKYWHERSRSYSAQLQRRKRRLLLALPAAAVVLIAFLVISRKAPNQANVQIAEQQNDKPSAVVDSTMTTTMPRGNPTANQPDVNVGRMPTEYERLIFTARRTNSANHSLVSQTKVMEKAIQRLATDSRLAVEDVYTPAALDAGAIESILLRKLLRSSDEQQKAIMKLLASMGSSRSVVALTRLAHHSLHQQQALAALQEILGTDGLAALARNTDDFVVSSLIIRQLLSQGTEPALCAYLTTVHDNRLRSAALTAIKHLADPPVESLLEYLNCEEEPLRLASALALGHLNGPEITQSLIDRIVVDPAQSDEAWIALLACRGELANQFLTYAEHRPQLLGHYNHARLRWLQIIH